MLAHAKGGSRRNDKGVVVGCLIIHDERGEVAEKVEGEEVESNRQAGSRTGWASERHFGTFGARVLISLAGPGAGLQAVHHTHIDFPRSVPGNGSPLIFSHPPNDPRDRSLPVRPLRILLHVRGNTIYMASSRAPRICAGPKMF